MDRQADKERDRGTDVKMDGWTDRWIYGRNFSPVFYETSSPIRSAALPTINFGATAYSRARVLLTS